MPVGFSSFPAFLSGLTSSASWLNEAVDYLAVAGGINSPPIVVSSPPISPPLYQIYLVQAPASGGFTAGQVVVYTGTFPSVSVTIDPPDGTHIGPYQKVSGDWQLGGFFHTGFVRLSAPTTVPIDFQGICHIVAVTSGAIVNPPAAATTSVGPFSTALVAGQIYTLNVSGGDCTLY